jgi:geranylgeranyl pyrophosphate synthase
LVNQGIQKDTFLIPIQEQLLKVEEKIRSLPKDHHPDLAYAINHLLSSGGKRIRPAIALLTGGMLGGKEESLIILASAIELLHTATLVHDDLIDGSLLRRGIATLNAQWSPAATVLTGDYIFAKAAHLAAETNSVELMKMFAQTLAIIVNGEITQLFRKNESVDRINYQKRIYAKTASLFELASAASAMLSPVPQKTIDEMKKFGYLIGMAFQIMDDVLDFIGDKTVVGKPVGNDLKQGVITLPVLLYREDNPNDSLLNEILDGKIIPIESIDSVVMRIRESKAIDSSIQEAKEYLSQSNLILKKMPDCEMRRSLEDLAYYIVNREK